MRVIHDRACKVCGREILIVTEVYEPKTLMGQRSNAKMIRYNAVHEVGEGQTLVVNPTYSQFTRKKADLEQRCRWANEEKEQQKTQRAGVSA